MAEKRETETAEFVQLMARLNRQSEAFSQILVNALDRSPRLYSCSKILRNAGLTRLN